MKRWRLIVVCVVAGAIANIVMAYACMFWLSPDPYPGCERAFTDSEAAEVWQEFAAADWVGPPTYHETLCVFGRTDSIVQRFDETLGPRGHARGVLVFQVGVPLRTLEAGLRYDGKSFEGVRSLRTESPVTIAGLSCGRTFPYGPLWQGLLINTFFYAAILWLLIRGPAETRRRWREFRGRCGRCGYPRGGSAVCTECGADLAHAWGTARAGSSSSP